MRGNDYYPRRSKGGKESRGRKRNRQIYCKGVSVKETEISDFNLNRSEKKTKLIFLSFSWCHLFFKNTTILLYTRILCDYQIGSISILWWQRQYPPFVNAVTFLKLVFSNWNIFQDISKILLIWILMQNKVVYLISAGEINSPIIMNRFVLSTDKLPFWLQLKVTYHAQSCRRQH